MKSAFQTIEKEFPDQKLAAAVYNVGAGLSFEPFLELKIEALEKSLKVNA